MSLKINPERTFKILITGASGFIGTNLLQYYLEKGNDVVNIDFKPPQNHEHFNYWKNIDITDYTSLEEEVLRFEPDYVLHMAAKTDLDGKSLSEYNANIEGVRNILSVLKKCRRLKRVIFSSSQLVCAGRMPVDDDDYYIVNLYGESKKQGELILKTDKDIPFEWLIVRPTSIWGPWFGEPYLNFYNMVLSGKYFHIGSKSCTKTFGYIGNLVHQVNELLHINYENISNEGVFYLGDFEPYNIEEWANEIAEEAGIKILRVPFLLIKTLALVGDMLGKLNIKFPMTSYRLHNMTTDVNLDLSKTEKLVPLLPFTRIQGVRQTLDWMRTKLN